MRELPQAMRDKVMSAADVLADKGLDGTTIGDIAAATGIPKATLYYYFAGKEEILGFLFQEVLQELGRRVAEVLRSDGTAAERLRAVVLAHLRVVEAYPAASRALLFDLGRAARMPVIDRRVEETMRGPLAELLLAGARDGTLREVARPRLTAVAVLGAVTSVGVNAIALGGSRSVEDVADDVADLVLSGLQA